MRDLRFYALLFLAVAPVALCASLVGCKQNAPAIGSPPTTFGVFDQAYTLSNGTVDVVIVPQIGRVMRYGYVGGPNELWNNPLAKFDGDKPTDWINWGGDKAWVWPQEGWRRFLPGKQAWPPPMDLPGVRHIVTYSSPLRLRTVSTLIKEFGFYIVRDYTLAPSGTELRVLSTMMPAADTDVASLKGLAPWTVAQLPWSPLVLGITTGDAQSTATDPLTNPLLPVSVVDKKIVKFNLPTEKESQKVGLDASHLASQSSHGTLLVQSIGPRTSRLEYVPVERAQVYSEPKTHPDRPTAVLPYFELEFTAPLSPDGKPTTLEVVWNLYRTTTDDEAMKIVQSLVR